MITNIFLKKVNTDCLAFINKKEKKENKTTITKVSPRTLEA